MRAILRADYFWQFIGGFVLGTIGVMSLHPGAASRSIGGQAPTAQTTDTIAG